MTTPNALPTVPTETRIAAVRGLVESGAEPSPANLLKASKKKNHPLHAFFWQTPESTWAHIGRYEGARRILQTTRQEWVIGGKTIETRMVEYTRESDGTGRWATVQEIVQSKELLGGYLREIEHLQESASEKMRKLRELISAREDH